MKKITLVSLFSLLFLSVSSTVAYMLKYIPITNKWVALGIGVGVLAISGIVCWIKDRNKVINGICFVVNAFALGFCIRAWYIFREFDNSLGTMLLVSLACLAYLLVFYFILYIPFIENYYELYLLIFLILTVIVYLVVIFTTKTTFVSTFGYYVIIEIAFIFAMSKPARTFFDLFRNVLISTYSVFVVALIIAVIMSGGDGLDGFDIGGADVPLSSPKDDKVKKGGPYYYY